MPKKEMMTLEIKKIEQFELQKEKNELRENADAQEQQFEANKLLLQECLNNVASEFEKAFMDSCYEFKNMQLPSYPPQEQESKPYPKNLDECLYSSFQYSSNAITINNIFSEKEDNCYKLYPTN